MATEDSRAGNDPSEATPSEPIVVESDGHFEELLDAHSLVLADFFADWCAPCVVVGDFVESAAEQTSAAVVKVDVEVRQALADRFNVRSLPTLVLFESGEPVERLVGLQDEADIIRIVQRFED